MGKSLINKFFEIAKTAAISKEDRRSFLIGSCGWRADGKVVKSSNGFARIMENGEDEKKYFRQAHSEYRLCSKLDKNSIVFVVRISKTDGTFRLAKPCPSCIRAMRARGVKKVYYTTGPDTCDVLILDKTINN